MDEASTIALNNLATKTGRSVPDWLAIARPLIPLGHRAGLQQLKTDYGIGHGYANLLMLTVRAEQSPDADADPVDAQYSGAEGGLRPLYDLLVERGSVLGPGCRDRAEEGDGQPAAGQAVRADHPGDQGSDRPGSEPRRALRVPAGCR